jgi:hypothetical protein
VPNLKKLLYCIRDMKEEYLICGIMILFSFLSLFYEPFQSLTIFWTVLCISVLCMLLHCFTIKNYRYMYNFTYFLLCLFIVLGLLFLTLPHNSSYQTYNRFILVLNIIFLFIVIHHAVKANIHLKLNNKNKK